METRFIIDSHVHLTPPFILNNIEKYRKQDEYFNLLCSSSVNENITAEDLIKHMEKNNIQKSVVFGFAFKDMDLCQKVNDYIIDKIKEYPERLIGFAVLNPLTGTDIIKEELKRCKKAGIKGIGELLPAGQKFNITDSNQMYAICNICQKYNWPLLIHINEPVGHYYKGKTKDSVKEGYILAQNFPETTFIFAHLGGGLCFYELMPEVKKTLKKVYYDTAAVPFLYNSKIYNSLKAAGVTDKILMGSDYPLISPVKYIKQIEKTDLTEKEEKGLLAGNFNRILKKTTK